MRINIGKPACASNQDSFEVISNENPIYVKLFDKLVYSRNLGYVNRKECLMFAAILISY